MAKTPTKPPAPGAKVGRDAKTGRFITLTEGRRAYRPSAAESDGVPPPPRKK